MHSLDAQTLVGHDVEGRVLGGRCVLGGPDEAVSPVQDHVTSVGGRRGGTTAAGAERGPQYEPQREGAGGALGGRGLAAWAGRAFAPS